MLDVLGGKPELVEAPPREDDWYANVFYIEGKKCVPLVHLGTLYTILTLDTGVGFLRPFGGFVYSRMASRSLEHDDLPQDALGPLDYKDVHLARTADRSMLGSMNDMVLMTKHIVRAEGGLGRCDASILNRWLHDVPNGARDFASSLELVRRRVAGQAT